MPPITLRQFLPYLGLIFLVLIFFIPRERAFPDYWYWSEWIKVIDRVGISNIYSVPEKVDYHPIWLYILDLFLWIQGSVDVAASHVYFLKIIVLLFDFASVIAMAFLVPVEKRNWLATLFVLLCPAFLYNTIAWGQIDAIPVFFVLFAVVSFFKKKPTWALISIVLAFNTKLQIIVFIPLLFILAILVFEKSHWKKWLSAILIAIATHVAINLPFAMTVGWNTLWNLYTSAVGRLASVSMNAFNFWHFIVTDQFMSDTTLGWFNISYHHWGLIMFCIASAIVMFPLGLVALRRLLRNASPPDKDVIAMFLLSFGLIAITFFFFNTQMHERYSHPMLIFFGAFGFVQKKWGLFITASIAYFLNMEAVLHFLNWHNYETFVFNSQVVASLFGIILIWATVLLYRLSWEMMRSGSKSLS